MFKPGDKLVVDWDNKINNDLPKHNTFWNGIFVYAESNGRDHSYIRTPIGEINSYFNSRFKLLSTYTNTKLLTGGNI